MAQIFTTWVGLLSVELQQLFTRVIIDCTELYIQHPSSLVSQPETFSSYKHLNNFKVLVGITPGGVVSFVS